MRLFVLVLALTACIFGPSATESQRAQAAECGPGQVVQEIPGHGVICVQIDVPGGPGTDTPGSHTDGVAICINAGEKIPCVTDRGVWFASHQCYAQVMSPQPIPESPVWSGRSPEQGDIWVCTTYAGPGTGGFWFFVPDGTTPTLIDPGTVAQNAVAQLALQVPVVHTAPASPALTYVGLDTWLWMDPAQWRELNLTVTAGAASVTVTAQPIRATWDLTDGRSTCVSAGRPWAADMSSTAQTDCSYTFEHVSADQSGGQFAVSSTLTYQVDWSCRGACSSTAGTLGEIDGLAGTGAIRVGERQSVVVQ